MQHFDPRSLDKFYTTDGAVATCLDRLNSHLKLNPEPAIDLWLEPSAGDGAFLRSLPLPRIGLDLVPEAEGITAGDFLQWKPEDPTIRIATVGNPPFGKNSSKAVAFFNHAAEFSTLIAMIFPSTFEKASVQRRLNKNFVCVLNEPLPYSSFLFQGQPYDVPTTFQIWTRSKTPRSDSKAKTHHPDLQFVSRNDAMVAFQRVGVRAGALKTDFTKIASASHLFLRSDRLSSEELIARLAALDFSHVRGKTAGNPSIAKSELIDAYTKAWGDGA